VIPGLLGTRRNVDEKLKGDRGAISMGLVVAILLLLFAAYEAKQFGPLLLHQFQFHDAAIEASKFSATKDANSVATSW
jgi:hypothetical protein